jgi:hypothetical protein
MDAASSCKWLHELLEGLPLLEYPFSIDSLPKDAVYFFYEKGEEWGHGGARNRVVRVGTHKKGNFQSRMRDHYVDDSRIDAMSRNKPKPSDRSIFRKNIGRAIIARDGIEYAEVWEIDFTSKSNRDRFSHRRRISIETDIEKKVSDELRKRFEFRFIPVPSGDSVIGRKGLESPLIATFSRSVIGRKGLESPLIATFSRCQKCRASPAWLGNYSPVEKVKSSGLWLSQHLNDSTLSEAERAALEDLLNR